MKINIKEFEKRKKYINCRKHPDSNLLIWNYSNACQYDGAWDKYTMMARGLITTPDGRIVSMGFKKFFNINRTPETQIQKLKWPPKAIYTKWDGVYLITYPYKNETRLASRGAFMSEQAIYFNKLFKKRGLHKAKFKKEYSYVFEGISPRFKIVVDYGDKEDIVLLMVKNVNNGNEINYIWEAKRLGVPFAKPIKFISMDHLQDYVDNMTSNEEGFVLKYSDDFRVKAKGTEYLRITRLLQSFSSKHIWECLKNKQNIGELLKDVPDEFYDWVRKWGKDLISQYAIISDRATRAWEKVKKISTRKKQAQYILKKHKDISALVFGLLDNQDISDMIWKMIKPDFEKPFLNEDKNEKRYKEFY